MNQMPFDRLFETSWEVCNKIGGIYTVLSTKAKTLQKLYKDHTIFLGPDVWTQGTESPWFTPCRVPSLSRWAENAQLPHGITVRVGRWEVPGRPIAILVGFEGMYAVKDQFYGRMWNLYGVDSLHAYGDYDEGCAFAHACGIVIESIVNTLYTKERVIAHFDEWTTGMGLLYVKAALPRVGTVFTTHATSIGRSICGNQKPLYDYLTAYDGDQMARELNMQAKHSLEKAAAHQADCFTTVSEITAVECEQLLGRRPDVVTPNGFEQNFVPSKAKLPAARRAARAKLLATARALTGCDYADDQTMIVITSGRCEYRNKGLDLFLDSIERLRRLNPARHILAYIMVPAWVEAPRADLAKAISQGKTLRLDQPYLTHWLHNPEADAVACRIRQLGFANDTAAPGAATVIYTPSYLNGTDGIFNSDYYTLLPGADATVFPSYYEPWGYTPLESVAFGVPTVTTSLSGFGQWILSDRENDFSDSGVNVIARTDSNYPEVADAIARSLEYLSQTGQAERTAIAAAAQATAQAASWANFIKFYDIAYRQALQNKNID